MGTRGRVVKALDLKSNGLCPRRFEPCRLRKSLCFEFIYVLHVFCFVNLGGSRNFKGGVGGFTPGGVQGQCPSRGSGGQHPPGGEFIKKAALSPPFPLYRSLPQHNGSVSPFKSLFKVEYRQLPLCYRWQCFFSVFFKKM